MTNQPCVALLPPSCCLACSSWKLCCCYCLNWATDPQVCYLVWAQFLFSALLCFVFYHFSFQVMFIWWSMVIISLSASGTLWCVVQRNVFGLSGNHPNKGTPRTTSVTVCHGHHWSTVLHFFSGNVSHASWSQFTTWPVFCFTFPPHHVVKVRNGKVHLLRSSTLWCLRFWNLTFACVYTKS